jgi:cell division protein FtsN
LARSRTAAADPFNYFVQAGAFRSPDEAESQRAKLALQGFDARVSEREQSGRTVFRVRIGPLDSREEAERIQQKLAASKVDAALVRVQR